MKALILLFPLVLACGQTKPPTPLCQDNSGVRVKMPDGTAGAIICCQHKGDCYHLGTTLCSTYDITQADNESASQFKTSDTVVEYTLQCHSR